MIVKPLDSCPEVKLTVSCHSYVTNIFHWQPWHTATISRLVCDFVFHCL